MKMKTVQTVTLDISIDPVDMQIGDDILDEAAVLAAIRNAAHDTWPGATIRFQTLQVGHGQGSSWTHGWINHARNDFAAETLLQSIDWTDEDLYARVES